MCGKNSFTSSQMTENVIKTQYTCYITNVNTRMQ